MRHKDDFYETPAPVVHAIAPYLPTCKTFLDPCCGTGAIMHALRSWFPMHRIRGIELNPELAEKVFVDHPLTVANALELVWPEHDVVVMNPPFKDAMAFVTKAIKHDKEVFALLRLSFLASKKRFKFWQKNPADVYVLHKRPSFTGGGTDAADYAWFHWGKGPKGRVTVI